MRRSVLVPAAALATAALLGFVGPTVGGEEAAAPDHAQMMKRWTDACTPGEFHAWLARFVGKWDVTMKMWLAPGQPLESKGAHEWSWAVEGKWLRGEGTTLMMGQPVRTFAVLGYDNFKRKYVGSVFNSLSTAIMSMEGTRDREGKRLDLYGPLDEPMTGEHDKPVLYRYTFADPDTIVMEVHDLAIVGEGTESRVVETTFRRKK